MSSGEDTRDVDGGWDDEENQRSTVVPPLPDVEVPTTPPGGGMFRLDSASRIGADMTLDSDALDLVEREVERGAPDTAKAAPSAPRASDPVRDMRERFSLGDYSGALLVAEEILEDDPEHAEALKLAESCQQVLQQMYTTRIGPLDRVPFVAVPAEQLRWLNIDHRAGFVLSHVDGQSSLEQILDVSGMAPLDALRILFELLQQRVIAFR